MRVLLVTQDDPFYLAKHLKYLFEIFPSHSQIIGCILLSPLPFGRKENMLGKIIRTYKIFGLNFLIRYSTRYLINKFNPKTKVRNVLTKNKVPIVELKNSNINSKDSLTEIGNLKPDLIISIAANQIFKAELLKIPSRGCLNLHTALLPKYRGLMPTFWALKNDEKCIGVSVFFMDIGIDNGPIIVQRKIEISYGISLEKMINITKRLGMESIIDAINKINDKNYTLIENDKNKATYFKFPTREDVRQFLEKGKLFYG